MAEEKSKGVLPDTSWLLAAASAFVYLTTYIYEYAYCSAFGIPSHLISPGVPTILLAAASIGTVVFSCLAGLGLAAPFVSRARDLRRSAGERFFYLTNALLLIAAVLGSASYGYSLTGLAWWVGGIAFFNVLVFGQIFFSTGTSPWARDLQLRECLRTL